MFLYNDKGLFARAYFITPDDNGEKIQHQYSCAGCQQFEVKGAIEIVPEPLATQVADLLSSCDYPPASVIKLNTGLNVKYVLGEGLAELYDGRYIATENCD